MYGHEKMVYCVGYHPAFLFVLLMGCINMIYFRLFPAFSHP